MEIYIDESGNLGGLGASSSKSDLYFVLVALIVRDDLPIRRCIKDIRRKKIKKKYRKTSELKFNESDDNIKRRVLECIGQTDNDIGYALMSRAYQTCPPYQYETWDPSGIYTDICKKLIHRIIVDYRIIGSVEVFIDKSLYGTQREKFDRFLADRTGLVEPYRLGRIRISHVDSKRCPCIQAADFIAGAIGRRYRDNDDRYYQKIQDRIAVKMHI